MIYICDNLYSMICICNKYVFNDLYLQQFVLNDLYLQQFVFNDLYLQQFVFNDLYLQQFVFSIESKSSKEIFLSAGGPIAASASFDEKKERRASTGDQDPWDTNGKLRRERRDSRTRTLHQDSLLPPAPEGGEENQAEKVRFSKDTIERNESLKMRERRRGGEFGGEEEESFTTASIGEEGETCSSLSTERHMEDR